MHRLLFDRSSYTKDFSFAGERFWKKQTVCNARSFRLFEVLKLFYAVNEFMSVCKFSSFCRFGDEANKTGYQ